MNGTRGTGAGAATGDVGADAWVHEVRERWRASGVLALLEDAVAAVWERNVARHDPGVAGDTAMTLGITSSENLRSRLLGAAGEWADRGVRIRAPWNSLTITHEQVDLHLMKAPPRAGSSPDFATLRWEGEMRTAAAVDNGRAYAPAGGQLAFDGLPAPRHPPDDDSDDADRDDDGAGLRHVVLVWTGDPVTATTTGRLAVPWQPPAQEPDDEARWLAVLPLWSHGPGDVPAPPRVPAVSIGFGAGPDHGGLPVRRAGGGWSGGGRSDGG